MPGPFLEVQDVRKSYGRTPALAGVSFHVIPGELFGLLGPNGAGKTTLMSLLAGLVPADGGSIRLGGEPFGPKHKPLVGLGTQDLALYPELTARENLTFFGKLYGLTGTDLSHRVNDTLSAVGLLDRAGHRVDTFSGGMKRRLNLAAAVVHGPKLLLLDEPTTGVDPQSRNHIYEQVKALNAAGMTVIYTSHYMEEVQALCPRIAILDAGKVVACDTIKNLLAALPATATLTLGRTTQDFLSNLKAIPGVTRVSGEANRVTVETGTLGPVLPAVAGLCHKMGIELSHLETTEPNLERVFLHLTGKTLRD